MAAVAGWLLTGSHNKHDSAESLPDVIDTFLAHHWQRPLAPQGMPPAHFSALEASLAPENCGQCHASQFQSWKKSLHSQTLSAGLLWQLRLMSQSEANQCLDCHAPLAEQKALLAQALSWPNAPASSPPAHIPTSLAHDGLVCAACHVRQHQRFGPPPARTNSSTQISTPEQADTSTRTSASMQAGNNNGNNNSAVHDGFVISKAFEDSRFCASCHQFPDNGPRTAGKLREDTYAQWQASPFASTPTSKGVTCQNCHMPNRQHVWQGIHSPDMVRQALSTKITVQHGKAIAEIRNSGAGHHFPTYMVPKIKARLVLVQGKRERVLAESVIGWQVDVALENEQFDTRLPAGKSLMLEGALPEDVIKGVLRNGRLELRLEVAPREHYERTFESMFAQADKMDAETLKLLEQALSEAKASRFSMIGDVLELGDRTAKP